MKPAINLNWKSSCVYGFAILFAGSLHAHDITRTSAQASRIPFNLQKSTKTTPLALSLDVSLRERLDQIANSYTADNTFMGSVLVARGNEILLNKGYGKANLERNIPNDPDTKFRIGSLTKQFTAA